MLPKIFQFVKNYQSEIILAVAVGLLTLTGYNLGKYVAYRNLKQPIIITNPNTNIVNGNEQGITVTQQPVKDPIVVASKKSTSKLYHFTWCPGAGKIAEANKLVFTNETAAIAAGYSLASNCKK